MDLSRSGNYGICNAYCDPLLGVFSLELASKFCCFPCNGEIIEALDEFVCSSLFMIAHPCIDLCNINSAAAKEVSFGKEPLQVSWPAFPVPQAINDDSCIKEVFIHRKGP